MKTVVASAAALTAFAAVLSGCGGSGSNDTAGGASGGEGAKDKKVTLTMLVSGNKAADGQDFELDVLPKMVHDKFPNITLEVQKLPDDQYNTSIKTKLAAGEGPDFYRIWPRLGGGASVIDLSKAGYLADLSDLGFMNNISAGAKEDMSYDGKIYGIAKGIDMLGTYYNKDLFAKAGISDIPQDWDAFLAACQKLKDAGVTPIVMGDKDPWWIQFGAYQLAANTVYAEDKEFDVKLQAGEQKFTDPKWIKAIEMYKELYDKGYIAKNTLGLGGPQATQMFVDGKAAMTFDGTWDYPTLTAKGAADFERGFFPLPGNAPGKPVWQAVSTAAGWGVNAKTKNLDAVKDVLNYWFDDQSDLFQEWVKLNPSISAFNGVPLTNELYKPSYELYQSSGNSIYFANQMWPNGVADILQVKFGEIIGGQRTTPEDVTKAMQEKFDQLWKK
ncbi:ABC transporter substrate-binding protein [Cohnella nanjingensis]|uniref:Extracellular solute-binding protein n=1 Tax=Cohnella nanjingensis TaxID=1387779 RepID=A0A7X0RT49_9BACL|nr:extracellular solute-binding protein [Cohnella nanjingensis]MBB6673100.1 extracellular solute-binding protein [Cohnella nanjingensis]